MRRIPTWAGAPGLRDGRLLRPEAVVYHHHSKKFGTYSPLKAFLVRKESDLGGMEELPGLAPRLGLSTHWAATFSRGLERSPERGLREVRGGREPPSAAYHSVRPFSVNPGPPRHAEKKEGDPEERSKFLP